MSLEAKLIHVPPCWPSMLNHPWLTDIPWLVLSRSFLVSIHVLQWVIDVIRWILYTDDVLWVMDENLSNKRIVGFFSKKVFFFLVLNCTSLAKKVSVSFGISQLSISCAYWNSQTKLYWWINRDRSYKDFGQLLIFTITKRANEPFESVDFSFCCSKESLDKTLFRQYTFFMLQISGVYSSLYYQFSYFD